MSDFKVHAELSKDSIAEIKARTNQPDRSPFFASFSEVSHTNRWVDGAVIWVANGANFDQHVFRRTGSNRADAGEWLSTGVTTGAAASW